MAATYDRTDLRNAVRDLIQNIPSTIFPDTRLDTYLLDGKRRLDNDVPANVTAEIPAAATTSQKFYPVSTLPGWIIDFSVVQMMVNPKPDILSGEPIQRVNVSDRELVVIDGVEYVRIEQGIASGKVAQVRYTVPWQIKDLGGATQTTITEPFKNPLELICAAYVCMGLSAKSAGALEDQLAADEINWSDKQEQYRRASNEFEKRYFSELNLNPAKPKAIIVRMDYTQRDQIGLPYHTHFRRPNVLS
jgi:hypothetical protein